MAQTKQTKAANVLNNALQLLVIMVVTVVPNPKRSPNYPGNLSNRPTTLSDLSETSLEQAMIDIGQFKDERSRIAKRYETNYTFRDSSLLKDL